jgi:acyl transferase domain-containing protein
MDTACSSSFLAFQQAILGLRTGQCDQAIVGGVNVCLRPVTALQFHKMNMLSVEGKCKYLDADASEYTPHSFLNRDLRVRSVIWQTSCPNQSRVVYSVC